VVVLGITDWEVCPVTLMLPGSSLKPVAPVTVHDKTDGVPLVIELGEAVNDEITGTIGTGVGIGVGVGVGVGKLVVVNVRSPDVDRLPVSSTDFTL